MNKVEKRNSIYQSTWEGMVFRIEEDAPEVGAYLYVYENGQCVYDYLQDSIEMCKEFALEEFSVPLDSWSTTPKLTFTDT